MTIKHMVGGQSFDRKIRMLTNPVKPIRKGMQNYMGFLSKAIKPYPPATIANRKPGPRGYSWYQRGFGTKTITGKRYPTSEQMSKKWSFRTRILANTIRGYITNEASYSKYVQGDKQVWYHANRGWRRVDKVVETSLNKGADFIGKEINKELRR